MMLVEVLGRMRDDFVRVLLAACRLDGDAGAGAVDEDAFLAQRGARFLEAFDDAFFVRHVDFAEDAVDRGGDLFAFGLVAVEDGDAAARGMEFARGCFTEAGRAACNDGRDGAIELHNCSLFARLKMLGHFIAAGPPEGQTRWISHAY